jgi:hypothetical protein
MSPGKEGREEHIDHFGFPQENLLNIGPYTGCKFTYGQFTHDFLLIRVSFYSTLPEGIVNRIL